MIWSFCFSKKDDVTLVTTPFIPTIQIQGQHFAAKEPSGLQPINAIECKQTSHNQTKSIQNQTFSTYWQIMPSHKKTMILTIHNAWVELKHCIEIATTSMTKKE
jgi:hypothetical protein